jgi:PIN domain nuclease of toxin-antitoxin system
VIVLDTHVWLWWASAPERLSERARSTLDSEAELGVCTISAWEVAMLVLRKRIALDRDVGAWVRQALAQERVVALPLTADVAVAAALLETEGLQGDPADRMIYATAQERGARLVTRDETLRAFDPARTVW